VLVVVDILEKEIFGMDLKLCLNYEFENKIQKVLKTFPKLRISGLF
jgi:hypothetical protein